MSVGILGAFALGGATAGERVGWLVLLGFVLLALAGVLALVGVIGEGVRIGLREASSDDAEASLQELVSGG